MLVFKGSGTTPLTLSAMAIGGNTQGATVLARPFRLLLNPDPRALQLKGQRGGKSRFPKVNELPAVLRLVGESKSA